MTQTDGDGENVGMKVGDRLRGGAGSAEVIVIKAPPGGAALTCAGEPMSVVTGEPAGGLAPSGADGIALGKRYADEVIGLELLVTRGGAGPLAVAGRPLELKQAKALPSSD